LTRRSNKQSGKLVSHERTFRLERKVAIEENTKFENKTEPEVHCAFSLLNLRSSHETGLSDRNSSSSQNHFLSEMTSVHHSIPETSLVGTKFGRFLSDFVTLTPSSMPALASFIDLPLLQQQVSTLSPSYLSGLDTCILSQKQIFRSFVSRLSGPHDPAALAYFLVSVRLGSLQSGDYQPDDQETYYQAINLILRSCYGEERVEVIVTHFLLCLFARLISLNSASEKHRGFAKVLLSTRIARNEHVDEGLKRAGGLAIDGLKVPLYSIIGAGRKLVEILLARFTIGVEVFRNLFPFLAAFIDSQSQIPDEYLLKYEHMLHGLVHVSPAHTIPVITVCHFQHIASNGNFSKLQAQELLIELVKFCNFIVTQSSLLIEELPPLIRGYILQIDCFKFLLQGDFNTAKLLLTVILDGLDFYTLQNGYFWYGGCMVHQLHLVLAGAAFLKMEIEYYSLRARLKPIFYFLKRPFPLPKSLSGLCMNDSVSLCECPNKSSLCVVSMLFEKLEAVCTENETTP